jgi:hypothetical protein
LAKEGGARLRVVAELVTEDAKGARRITETAGDIGGGFLVDEESAQGFILTLEGEQRGEEELLVGRYCYLITSTERHKMMMLQKHWSVNMFGPANIKETGMDRFCQESSKPLGEATSCVQGRGLIGMAFNNQFKQYWQ